MLQTITATKGPLESKRFYRRLMGVCVVVGCLTYIVAITLGYVLLGTAVYWMGFLGLLGIRYGTGIELYDEREQQIEREAGGLTLTLFAFVLVLGAPGLVALDSAGYYEAPPELFGAMYGYAVLYLVFGVIYTFHRHRS